MPDGQPEPEEAVIVHIPDAPNAPDLQPIATLERLQEEETRRFLGGKLLNIYGAVVLLVVVFVGFGQISVQGGVELIATSGVVPMATTIMEHYSRKA